MKILLISPPTISAIKTVVGTTGPPLGLGYLASMVRDEHEVKIVDSIAENLSYEQVGRIIKNYDPDLIGITATTSMVPDAYVVAKKAKEYNKDVKIVMGGPHVTFVPEMTFEECPCIDYIVRGEGEITFTQLVDGISKNSKDMSSINGLSFKNNGGVVNNPPQSLIRNVDTIPTPSYDLLPMKSYQVDGIRFATIVTSRGCPFNCIFCSSSLQFGRIWRGHSDERVLKELMILREDYGIREIEFLDDTFTLNRPRAIKISERIKKEGLDISWTASSRVDTFNSEIARAMKNGGCHTVYFGVESGSQKTLDFIGKRITTAQAKASVKKAKNSRLKALGSFIIGFPYETMQDVKKTIKFSKKVGVDYAQFTVATPYPGTRLWHLALNNKLIFTFNWRKFTTLDPVMKLKNFTPQQITKMLRLAYFTFYLRPKILLRDLIMERGFIFRRAIPQAIKLFKDRKV